MNRRTLLQTATLGIGGISSLAFGDAASPSKLSKIMDTAAKCHSTGLRCLAHCEQELAKGNKTMADCLGSVQDMLTACDSLQKLAARNSPHLPSFTKVCSEILNSCAKICEPHIKHMEVCKNCRDACLECDQACKSV